MNFILDQHAAGAAAAWLWRDSAVHEPHYSLRDLDELDDRLRAYLQGLTVAGESGWNLAVDELKWNEPGELFVVAVLAIQSDDAERFVVARKAVGESTELRRALVSALGWVSWDRCQPLADRFLDDANGFWRYVGLAAYELHRVDLGDRLTACLSDDDECVRARAARCVGTLARIDLLDHLVDLLSNSPDDVRFHAAWSLALRSENSAAVETLGEFARANSDHSASAASLLMNILPIDQASSFVNELTQAAPEQVRLATTLSGHLGIVDGIPWLIEMMKLPMYARVAGESFTRITGLRLDERPLEGEPPDGFQSGPDDDPENEDVDLDADENLPWPNPNNVAALWQSNAERFSTGKRYLLGYEMSDSTWIRKVLVLGRQRERATAAIELALDHPTQALFDVRDLGSRQIAALECGELPTEEYRCIKLEAGIG